MRNLIKAFVLGALTLTHGARAQDNPQTVGRPKRIIAAGSWQVVRTIGLDSDVFEDPFATAASNSRIVVIDGGDNSVKSFRITGEFEWKVGRRGRGPGEFIAPLDISLDDAGNALVNDPDGRRVTIIDPAGKVVRTVVLPGRADRARVGARHATYLLIHSSDSLVRLIDTLGVVQSLTYAPRAQRSIRPLGREISAIVPVARGYQLFFRWSSGMLVVDRAGAIVQSCSGIDSLSFPAVRETRLNIKLGEFRNIRSNRVDPRARAAAVHAAPLGRTVAVVPAQPQGQRAIDIYAADCGRYIETRPLPFVVSQLAGNQDYLVAMLTEPVPHLAVLRWTPR